VDQSNCSVDGCERSVKIISRGWCNRHYIVWRTYGDPRGVELETRPCRVCETPVFKTPGIGRWPSYCSEACRAQGSAKWHADYEATHRKRKPMVSVPCATCGKQMERATRTDAKKQYCSKRCGRRAGQPLQDAQPALVKTAQCVGCGATFEVKGKRRKVCSVSCAKPGGEYAWQYFEDRRAERQRPCLHCGATFIPKEARRITFCSRGCAWVCSRECRSGHYQQVARHPAERQRKQARRAAKLGLPTERFDDREIFERDGWRCGICRMPVDPQLKHPHVMSASLDHIIPLDKRGSHTRKNVQLAHLKCNSSKHNRVVAQLQLFG
jgi:endogenous inhibitor of DNA gyrase (YacG/DUF329 family)